MDRFWNNLQLPKAKIKKPQATADSDKNLKMGQIIGLCLYVNTHISKGGPGYFETFSHGYEHIHLALIHNFFRATQLQKCSK